MRAKALSAEMGWTVVPNTREWIYGNLDDIFVPPSYDCILPPNILDTSGPEWKEYGGYGWDTSDRIYLTRDYQHLLQMERLVRVNQVDGPAMDEFVRKAKLWSMDSEHLTLPYGESVPRGEEKAFLAQAAVLEKEWIPNEGMQAQIVKAVLAQALLFYFKDVFERWTIQLLKALAAARGGKRLGLKADAIL